mgnify:CR=1 FL=1
MVLTLGPVALPALTISASAPLFSGRRSLVYVEVPGAAEPTYEAFCEQVATLGVPVERGIFGADMKVELLNDGPVTLLLDTPA